MLSRLNRTWFAIASTISISLTFVVLFFVVPFAFKVSWIVVLMVYAVLLLIPMYLISLRYRDCSISGWFTLVCLIPGSYLLLFVLLSFFPGEGQNKYGPPMAKPKSLTTIAAVILPALF